VNLPVPAGSGDETFCSLVEHAVVPLARAYAPQLVLVSAGFDAHRDDPLAGCAVSDGGYAAMAGSVRRLAAELDAGLGIVLEGGYEIGALSRSLVAVLEVAGPTRPLPSSTFPCIRSPHVHGSGSQAAGRRCAGRPAQGAGVVAGAVCWVVPVVPPAFAAVVRQREESPGQSRHR
jgi:hypothetical protein